MTNKQIRRRILELLTAANVGGALPASPAATAHISLARRGGIWFERGGEAGAVLYALASYLEHAQPFPFDPEDDCRSLAVALADAIAALPAREVE